MDIINFDALKAQGKVLPAEDVDLTEDYFIIGKRNVHYNTNSFKATEYPIYAIKAGDVMGVNTKYKVYTALLTQSGVTAPVATVLENTLGGTIVWTRNSIGVYTGTSSNLFVENKTICFTTFGNFAADPRTAAASYTTDSTVTLNTVLPTDGPYDVFSSLSIEIRVYN